MRIDDPSPFSPGAAPSGGGALAPTRDEFLRLFVAQLEHQDPLDPSNPSDMVAELAQLTNVEQTAALGARLDALVAQQESSARASLLGLTGRTVEATADAFTLAESPAPGQPLPIVAELDRAAATMTVIVRDAAGAEVRRVELGPQPAGARPLLDGVDLPPGTYQLELEAVDAAGAPITARPVVRGVVSQISFADAGARLRVGELVVNPADIASVS